MTYAQFQTVPIGNIRVHVCPTQKFKTTTLSVFIQQDLSPQYLTQHALLPNVLQRGTVSYPSTLDLKRKCEEMYGATLFGDVFKRGERHIAQFGMEIANEQYLRESNSLLEEGLHFFGEVLSQPLIEHDGFKDSFMQAEKKNLRQKIESLPDDKIRYAGQKMIEAMCQGEPFALFNHGRIEDLNNITAQSLYTYYQEMMNTCPIDFYVVGNVTTEQVVESLKQQLKLNFTGTRKEVATGDVHHPVQEEKVVVEKLDVKQGKLNMGCRTQISVEDEDYPALLLYNGVLGGFAHSKLFMNVREKASLAYYCSSRMESHKGILTIQSGIEVDNYEKAVKIIKEQLEEMRKGNISDNELSQTKAILSNQFREQEDRSFDMINYHYHGMLSGKTRPMGELLEQIVQVTASDIQKVAEKVQLDTIYFLRDQGGESDAKD